MKPQEAQELADKLLVYMIENEVSKCLCCQSSMNKSEHTLTAGMLSGLMKFANYCLEYDKRQANPRKDLPQKYALTINEMTNWTKLRFFGLIAKYKENNVHKGGMWVITRNGWAFLRGDLTIPKFVRTFRNKIVEKCPERIAFYEVYGSQPYFPNKEDLFIADLADGEDFNLVKNAIKKNKRGKNKCPMIGCDGVLIKKMDVEIVNELARANKYQVCNKCGYKSDLQTVK